MFTLMLLLVVLQDAGDKAAKPQKQPDPKNAIVAIVKEVAEKYREIGKEYRSKKTSAERTDFLDSAVEEMRDWASGKADIPYVCETRVQNVVKNSDTGLYYLVCPVGKDLLPWQKHGAVISAVKMFKLEVDDELRTKLEPKQTVRISGKLNTDFSHHVSMIQSMSLEARKAQLLSMPENMLISIYFDRSSLSGASFPQGDDYVTFFLDVESIEIVK
jgi:hypothetical protein